MFDPLWPHEPQHARPPCPSPTPGVYPNPCPLKLVTPSNHLILCNPLLPLPSIFPSIRAGEEGSNIEWDGWVALPTQWTWVWVDSGSWWWTGGPRVLWFMGLQRVKHDWATELNWTYVLVCLAYTTINYIPLNILRTTSNWQMFYVSLEYGQIADDSCKQCVH